MATYPGTMPGTPPQGGTITSGAQGGPCPMGGMHVASSRGALGYTNTAAYVAQCSKCNRLFAVVKQ